MKGGEMVRFAKNSDVTDSSNRALTKKTHIGLLVEYCSTQQVATILYEGKLLSIPGYLFERAGRKDLETR